MQANQLTPEEEAIIDGIELAKDYGLTRDIPPADMELYELLIRKRSEEERHGIM